MSDTFLIDIYRKMLSGVDINDIKNSYIYYPWDIIATRFNRPIVNMNVSIRVLGKQERIVKATYVEDLQINENSRIILG